MFQAGVNVSGRYRKWPVFSRPLMAGFGDTLVLSGRSHEEALDWLEHARAAGMRTRFTLPRRVTRTPAKLRPTPVRGRRPAPPP